MTVSIVLNLPVDVYRALIAQATAKGCQVHTLIETAVTGTVRSKVPRPAPRRPRKAPVHLDAEDRVELGRRFHEDSWSARRLAEHYGVSVATASNIAREERPR